MNIYSFTGARFHRIYDDVIRTLHGNIQYSHLKKAKHLHD